MFKVDQKEYLLGYVMHGAALLLGALLRQVLGYRMPRIGFRPREIWAPIV